MLTGEAARHCLTILMGRDSLAGMSPSPAADEPAVHMRQDAARPAPAAAFALIYLIAAPTGLGRRIRHLLVAGLAPMVSGGWFVLLVSLWPYIAGSTKNSLWQLAIGYNGLGRIFGGDGNASGGAVQTSRFGGSPASAGCSATRGEPRSRGSAGRADRNGHASRHDMAGAAHQPCPRHRRTVGGWLVVSA
jgi:hypothetical protein